MTRIHHRSTNNENAHNRKVISGRKAWTDGSLGGWLGKKENKQA